MFPGVLGKECFAEKSGVRIWPVLSSLEIKRMIRHGATVCAKYTFIYPIQNIPRILKVRTGTWG